MDFALRDTVCRSNSGLPGEQALSTLVTIDEAGTVHREALLAPDKPDAITARRWCFQLEDDRMLFFASRKREYRFGRVTFDLREPSPAL